MSEKFLEAAKPRNILSPIAEDIKKGLRGGEKKMGMGVEG